MGEEVGFGVGSGEGDTLGKGVLVHGSEDVTVAVPLPQRVHVVAPGAESVSVKLFEGHVRHDAPDAYLPGTHRQAPGRVRDSEEPLGQYAVQFCPCNEYVLGKH